jgi:hypothetical protein
MCNLYSMTRNQETIRRLFRVTRDLTGNLPVLPAIFPDMMAPIIRVNSADGERQLEMMRWGMPRPAQLGDAFVTNIRNTKSLHWRRWLGAACRCPRAGDKLLRMGRYKARDALVRARRRSPALRLRRDLDGLAWQARPGKRTDRGRASALRLPDDRSERRRGADTCQGDAGAAYHGRGMGRLASRAMDRGRSAATAHRAAAGRGDGWQTRRCHRIAHMTPEPPPTIAHLKGHGLKGLFVTCANAACSTDERRAAHTKALISQRDGHDERALALGVESWRTAYLVLAVLSPPFPGTS